MPLSFTLVNPQSSIMMKYNKQKFTANPNACYFSSINLKKPHKILAFQQDELIYSS